MAYVHSVFSDNGGSSITLNYSADEDDWMYLIDSRQYGSTTAPSGWTALSYNANSSLNYTHDIWHRRATASEPTSVTLTCTSGSHDVQLIVCKGVDTTTAHDVTPVSRASGNATSATAPAITPTNANTLILYINLQNGKSMVPEPGLIKAARSGGSGGQIASYYTYGQAGSTTVTSHDWTYEDNVSWNPAIVVISLRDDGNDERKGYVYKDDEPATLVSIMGTGGGKTGHLTGTADINIASTITTLDGVTTSHRRGNNATQDFEYNVSGFGYFLDFTSQNCSIVCHSRTPSIDLEDEIVSFSTNGDPEVYQSYSTLGKHFGLGDASNFRLWKFDAIDTKPSGSEAPLPILIEVDGGFEDSEVGTVNATLLQSITHIAMGGPGIKTYKSSSIGFLYILKTMKIVGGSTTFPCSMEVASDLARTSSLRTVSNQTQQSTTQFFCAHLIQIGNGSIATRWDSQKHSMEWPSAYDENALRVQMQISENKLGLIIYASSSCNINFANAVFNLGNFHRFEINSSTSTSATYIETGAQVIGATVTLNDIGRAIAGMTFAGCKEITKNSADLSGGNTIQDCVDTDAITINGATQAAIQSDIDDLANCTFSGNNVAIRIEYTGTGDVTLSFDAITWTSNTTDIHYNSTNSSALTANMNNGANASTSAISGSATSVTINNTITVKVTVKDANNTSTTIQNARVYLKADTGGDLAAGTVILNGLSNASGIVQDTGFNFTNNQPVTGWVRKTTSGTLYKQGLLGGTILISGYDVEVFLVPE